MSLQNALKRVGLALILLQVELVVEGLPSLRAAPAGTERWQRQQNSETGLQNQSEGWDHKLEHAMRCKQAVVEQPAVQGTIQVLRQALG